VPPRETDCAALAEVDGRLYLSGLDPHLTERLRRTGRLEGPIRTFEATPLVGESTEAARQAAQAWLVKGVPADGQQDPPGRRSALDV